MHFEEAYPNKPPGVKFISDMFHPNVYGTGELCLDILQNRWSPTYDVAAVLTSIQRYALPRWQDWRVVRRGTDTAQLTERPQYVVAGQCRGIEPVQGEPQGVHQARPRDGGEELGGLRSAAGPLVAHVLVCFGMRVELRMAWVKLYPFVWAY
jgi:hypothetical protein